MFERFFTGASLFVLGCVCGAIIFSLRVVHFKNQFSLGELVTSAITIFLAILVAVSWRARQFGHETAQNLILQFSGGFRTELGELTSIAESLAFGGWDEEKSRQLVKRFKSLRNTIAEIELIADVVLDRRCCESLISAVTTFKRLTTSRTKTLPLTQFDIPLIEASAVGIRRILTELQADILTSG